MNQVSTRGEARTRRVVSASQRRAEIMIGILFIACAAVSIPAAFVVDPILGSPDFLGKVFPNKGAVQLSALLWSINNIGIVFIAAFAFRVLRKLNEALAVGYLATRIVESSVMMLGIAATFIMVPLSQEFIKAGAPQASSFLAIADTVKHARYLGLTGLSLPLLGLGGLIFTWMLFRFRLVARSISVVGLVSYALVFLVGTAGWFDIVDPSPSGNVAFLALPVAVFEIVLLPVWLFVKGFKTQEAVET